MMRCLTLARSLMNEPRILLLDEPTTGLDPQARHVLWDRLFRLKEQGTTIVLTTHYMDEAEQLCDRLVVVDKGTIMAEGAPEYLTCLRSTRGVLDRRVGADRIADVATQVTGVGDRFEVLPDRILIFSNDGDHDLEEIIRRGLKTITSLVRRSSLEDVSPRLPGRSLIE